MPRRCLQKLCRLNVADEYRALPKAEREQEPWRSLRQALAREFLRLS